MSKLINKTDNKFIIFIICLVCIPILLILLLIAAQSCSKKVNTTGYNRYEESMKTAASNYLTKIEQMPVEKGDYIIVNLDTLVEQKYIKSPKDELKDTCTGQVTVRKGTGVNYIPYLKCDKYTTRTLKDSIMKGLTTDSDGLYKMGDEYVFRGLDVRNFVKLNGITYRIISMDKYGILKLYNRVSEKNSMYWDQKYNKETGTSAGINIYGDSYLVEELYRSYLKDSRYSKIRPIMVAQDICVYSKKKSDRMLDKSSCVEVVENQYISLLGLDDFMNASLDKNCVDLYSKSCLNYNYLNRVEAVNTWTKDVVATNTYQAYRIVDGTAHAENLSEYEPYNHVIYIDGSEIVVSGTGSKNKPYVLTIDKQ